MKDIVLTFKNELRNYNHLKKQLESIHDRLDVLWYELTGVKGVDASKERGGYGTDDKKMEISGKIDRLEEEKKRIELEISYINNVLQLMPREVQSACILIYARGEKFSKVAMNTYRSVGSLQRLIDSNIEQALNRYRYR